MLLTKGNSEERHFVRLHKTEKLILSVKGLRKSHCVTQLRSPLLKDMLCLFYVKIF